jgi:hypothetical protein
LACALLVTQASSVRRSRKVSGVRSVEGTSSRQDSHSRYALAGGWLVSKLFLSERATLRCWIDGEKSFVLICYDLQNMKIKNHSRNEKYVGFVEKKKKKKKKKKILSLSTTGAGESGKSTVLKQVKNVYKIPFNKVELDSIQRNDSIQLRAVDEHFDQSAG